SGLVARGQKLKLITDWYLCHQPERGELVYYRFSSQSAPVARVVRAASGDAFHVSRDEQRGAWNLTVNGELLLGPDGTPYFFGAGPASMLAVYEKSNGGRLAEGDLIVLSNVPPGSFDSGIFGVVSRADLVGRLHPVSD
ncbi:MAG TPA: S26 family signal peptidase, partial [Bdellovibrionales bacterium]|nr:S26 family signal peptidase [Bdellovibrionales bacterium]